MTTMTSPETTTDRDASLAGDNAARPLVEIGCIVWKGMNENERQAACDARTATLTYLQKRFPEFQWHMPLIYRRPTVDGPRQEPTVLIGVFIGALGASFEQQYYFRHITLVDEET